MFLFIDANFSNFSLSVLRNLTTIQTSKQEQQNNKIGKISEINFKFSTNANIDDFSSNIFIIIYIYLK